MSVNDLMVLRGRVATDVSFHAPKEPGMQPFSRFRIVVPRLRRTDKGDWEEGEPLWYTVKAWGALAENINLSLRKGQPVLVSGRPTAQSWVTSEQETRNEIAVNAISVGHDLVFGVASYSKIKRDAPHVSADSDEEAESDVEELEEALEDDWEVRVDADGVILDDVEALAG